MYNERFLFEFEPKDFIQNKIIQTLNFTKHKDPYSVTVGKLLVLILLGNGVGSTSMAEKKEEQEMGALGQRNNWPEQKSLNLHFSRP